ncbi:DegV family protein [Clostridium sp. YIM B02515]|uniref:DegV family protein n=1 Tax=Clostridium rhizosphaerae TaxID=2803861 RepID=A0ABS1T9M9_9CLOT|nr:DegV family protein [Clostridium rhizosphaerae]MBL4936050.1 DegV family protein [Clostridium rhizosphaerae]
MQKIALITDSSCDLTKEIIDKYDIKILPLRIIYKDKEYIDRVTISPNEVYDNLVNEIPTTSMPSMGDMENLFSLIEEQGYTHVIAITLSSGLSGTFNALKLVSENHLNLVSYLFDSKSLSLGLGALVYECGKLISDGKSFEEIVDMLPAIKEKISLFYVVETLEYLKKGGRIGKVAGTIGDLLNIKPIISIDDEGKYFTYAKVRGRKQSITKLIDIAKETLETTKAKIFVMHGGALEQGEKIYDLFSKMPNVTSIYFTDISPALGVHTGPGLLGIAVVKEN